MGSGVKNKQTLIRKKLGFRIKIFLIDIDAEERI